MTTTIAGFPTTVRTLCHRELRALKVNRHAQRFRAFDRDERAQLQASMETGYDPGHPIVVWAATEEIIDGRNRRDAAVQLQLTAVSVAYAEFPDEAAVVAFVIAENLARRHLTQQERARLAGALVLNGSSTRSAAKQAGVSQRTAQRVADRARAAGESSDSPDPEARVTGRDGKTYPATRPKTHVSGPPNPAVELGRVGDDLFAAQKHVGRVHANGALTGSLGEQAARYAQVARDVAALLEGMVAREPVTEDAQRTLYDALGAAGP